ncbi:MAG: PQQ-binding-like beta-propeller repeat protein, partial [Bacteroidia bacterium]|nr:PQQ-binding-like beta-propeller repeat protein [Bacteroidia bacterium]
DYATDIVYSKDRNKIFLSGTYNGASLDLDVTGTGGPNNIGPSTDTDAFYVQYDKSFEHVGHAKFYGPSEQHIASMSLWNDTGDTILVGGGFKSQLSYGSSTLNAYGALDSYMLLIKTGATPTYLKSIHFGGSQDDILYTTCVSTSREAVAGGYFNGKVDFDASTSTYELTPTFPSGYIVAYGDNLLPYTNIYLSGSGDDEINTLTIDNNGEVFASGTYTSFAKIGSFNLTSAGGTDVFIQRKHKTGADAWAINAARLPNGVAVFNPQEISNKLSSAGNDKSRSIASGDTSVYLAYIKNDTAYVQRINRNTGGPIWSQKINKNGSDIAGIVVDDQYLYFVGDSAGVHITQRVNKNTGGPIWSQRVPNGKSKAITQDHSDLYTVKDSSGYAVVSRVNKNTGGPIWSQRIAGHSGSSIAVMGDDIFMMSDSSGNIVLRKINKNTGGPIWSQRVGTGTLGRVTVNYTKGAVYISGTFTGTSSYLGLTSGGGTDGFVARVNKNTGGPVWSQRVGGPGADSIKVLEVTLGSDVYIAGNTQGGTFGNTSAGPGIFLVRLSLDSLDKSTFIEPIKTNFDEFDCQIYPNPTRDIFNISATLSAPEYVQIRLLDLKGRIVFQEMQGKQSIIQSSVDIGELPNGLYILQIQAGKQQVTRKVVKY